MPSVDRMLRSGGTKKTSTTKRTTTSTGNGTSLASSVGAPRYDKSSFYQPGINSAQSSITSKAGTGTNTSTVSKKTNPDATYPTQYSATQRKMMGLPDLPIYTPQPASLDGGHYAVNLDTDYQSKINQAVSEGDYYSAAKYEAQRNAKINYLNSVYANPNDYATTNNYVNDYYGGYQTKYSYNDLKSGNLPDNWTQANIAGALYRRDLNDGTIYRLGGPDGWTPVGNRINPATGEWMFDNADIARQAAYANYIGATGDTNPNALSQDYINRIQQGTQNQYTQKLADELYQRDVLAQAYQDRINRSYMDRNDNDGWRMNQQGIIDLANGYINNSNVSSAQREVLHTNSFETDPTLPNDYHIYGVRNYSDPYFAYIQDAYRRGRYTSR